MSQKYTHLRFSLNLKGAQQRFETLEGKKHRVVPTIMLTEGVHNGSQGPLLYVKEEYGKFPWSWNAKPVVVYHPSLNGEGISACDPIIMEKQKIGIILNSACDGRLKNETWIDEEKCKLVDNRILEALDEGKTVEVSTGLFHEVENTAGEWKGEKYIGIVRNIQPDHLAILPDQIGACSIEKGAGLLQNATTITPMPKMELSLDDIRDQSKAMLRAAFPNGYPYVCEVYSKYIIYDMDMAGECCCFKLDYKVKDGKVVLGTEATKVRKVTSYVENAKGQTVSQVIYNEDVQGPIATLPPPSADQLSEVMRKQQVQEILAAKYGNKVDGSWGGWVVDIFANYAVWHKDGKLFRLPYTYVDDKISLADGEPEEIDKASYYRAQNNIPIDGTASPIANQETIMAPAQTQPKPATNTIMAGAAGLGGGKSDGQARTTDGGARSEMVNRAIAGGKFSEGDRAWLEGLSDELLGKVAPDVIKGATQEIIPYSYGGVGDRSNVHAQQNGQPTMDQYLATAPPAIRAMLQNGLNQLKAEKDGLIRVILSNKNNRFSKPWLEAVEDVEFLKGLAGLAAPQAMQSQNHNPLQNYGGQAGAPQMFITENVEETGTPEPQAALPIAGVFSSLAEEADAKVG